jgi:hypothetical protein
MEVSSDFPDDDDIVPSQEQTDMSFKVAEGS